MSSMMRSAFVTAAGSVKSVIEEASLDKEPNLSATALASSPVCSKVPAYTLASCINPDAPLSPTAPKLFCKLAAMLCMVEERPLAVFTFASMSASKEDALLELTPKSSSVLSHMCIANTELLDLPPHINVFSPSHTASHCELSLA